MIRVLPPMLAISAAIGVVVVAVTFVAPPTDPGRHEASLVIRGADLRFNADRFSRITAALLRDQNQDISDGRIALPIEGTRLIRVSARATDPELALRAVESLAGRVVPTLEESGLGTFDLVGDPQVVRRSRSHPGAQSVVVGAGATALLSVAGLMLVNAWRRTKVGADPVKGLSP